MEKTLPAITYEQMNIDQSQMDGRINEAFFILFEETLKKMKMQYEHVNGKDYVNGRSKYSN
ncbi:MAG: hypothetical protein AAB546_00150 [Patescibacteria group bacterium]